MNHNRSRKQTDEAILSFRIRGGADIEVKNPDYDCL